MISLANNCIYTTPSSLRLSCTVYVYLDLHENPHIVDAVFLFNKYVIVILKLLIPCRLV